MSNSQSDGNCSTSRLWLVAAVVSALIALGLVAYIIQDKVSSDDGDEEDRMKLIAYPQFRTAEEQADYVTQICAHVETNLAQEEFQNLSYVGCEPDRTGYISLISYGYNACCKWERQFIAPPTALTPDGVNVTLAQNVNGRSQYFDVEECTTPRLVCSSFDCQCVTQDKFFSAVIIAANGGYESSWIVLPGCCKCINLS